MQNLSRKELGLIAKKRNICGYKSMPKDKLLRIFNNNGGDRKSLLKSKKEETKKCLHKPTRNSPFKLNRQKIKKSLHKPVKKKKKKIFSNQK